MSRKKHTPKNQEAVPKKSGTHKNKDRINDLQRYRKQLPNGNDTITIEIELDNDQQAWEREKGIDCATDETE